MHLRVHLSLIIVLFGLNLGAQIELNGYVVNTENGAPIAEVSIQVKEHLQLFCMTDNRGYFSLFVPEIQCTLVLRHLSYELQMYGITVEDSLPLNILLVPSEQVIDEVVISAERNNARDNELRKISFRKEALEDMTSGFGEADVIRSLQSMPGIHKSSEVNAALNVRGTGHGNNRVTMDGQDLHNSYHLLGIAPMFNPDILESVVLHKSGFNAQVGNALSSFLQVETRTPDMYDHHFSASVCNLSVKGHYEGPLIKGKVSILLAGRYSFFDMVTGIDEQLHEHKKDYSPLPFYRLNELFLKLHFRMKNDWNADFTAFHTNDKFLFETKNLKLRTDWKNGLYSFNLTKSLSSSSRILIHSGLSVYNFEGEYNPYTQISRRNDMTSWDSRVNYNGRLENGLVWDVGAFSSFRYYYIESQEKFISYILRDANTTEISWLSGAYGNLRFPVTKNLELEGGLRFSHYFQSKRFLRLAPRFQVNMRRDAFAMNLSYDRTYQFAHLISPLGFNMPADLWYPAGLNSPLQQSDQYALHFHYDFGQVKTDVGFFYKNMNGLSDLSTGAELLSFHPSEALVYGRGNAYGVETGWHLTLDFVEVDLSYTYSKSRRVFEEINDGLEFSPPYDLPHQIDINLKGELQANWKWNVSWFWASGQVTTMPTAYAFLPHGAEAAPYPIYTERYNFRMPPSHRMDVSLKYKWDKSWGINTVTFGIYNAYHNSNPYFLYFVIKKMPDDSFEVKPRQLSIFPITPFVSYKVQWK